MLPVKALVTGAGGQLATALVRLAPAGAAVTALSEAELDITRREAVLARAAELKPTLIINAAAYTAVDKAEGDAELAHAVNADGAGNLAAAAREQGARLLHVSTDFVFDGAQSRPYRPDDSPRPLGVYGMSKLAGEDQVQKELGTEAFILRTAWVYAAGGRNFVLTMLKFMAERGEVQVVADQVGAPTWASSLATALWAAAARPAARGIHHWTDAGVASWYDFAVAIAEEGLARGLLKQMPAVSSIATADYPTAARRPAYSVLDRGSAEALLGIKPAHWRVNLRKMLEEVNHA